MSLTNIETQILLKIRNSRSYPKTIKFWKFLGTLGEHALMWVILGTVFAFTSGDYFAWLVAIAGVAGAQVTSMVLKRLIRRPRPNHPELDAGAKIFGKWSMPSSHAASSAAAAVLYAPLLPLPIALTLIGIAILVGFSRLVVGVHYLTDILVGVFLGVLVALLTLWFAHLVGLLS